MSTVIVTVVITLGIIIAGGFLIYFLGDLFMSLASHGKKDDEAIKGKNQRDKEKIKTVLAEKYPEDAEKIENDSDYAAVVLSGGKVEAYDPNEDKKEEAEPETDEEIEVEQPTQPEEEPATEEVEETVEDDQAERERIEKRRQEILDRINRLSQEMQEEPEEAETEEVDLTEEDSTEEGEEQAESAANKEDQASTILTGGSSAQTDGTVASEAIEQTTNALADTYDALTDTNAEYSQEELESIAAKAALITEQVGKMIAENEFAETVTEDSETLAESIDVEDSVRERDPTSIRGI